MCILLNHCWSILSFSDCRFQFDVYWMTRMKSGTGKWLFMARWESRHCSRTNLSSLFPKVTWQESKVHRWTSICWHFAFAGLEAEREGSEREPRERKSSRLKGRWIIWSTFSHFIANMVSAQIKDDIGGLETRIVKAFQSDVSRISVEYEYG